MSLKTMEYEVLGAAAPAPATPAPLVPVAPKRSALDAFADKAKRAVRKEYLGHPAWHWGLGAAGLAVVGRFFWKRRGY